MQSYRDPIGLHGVFEPIVQTKTRLMQQKKAELQQRCTALEIAFAPKATKPMLCDLILAALAATDSDTQMVTSAATAAAAAAPSAAAVPSAAAAQSSATGSASGAATGAFASAAAAVDSTNEHEALTTQRTRHDEVLQSTWCKPTPIGTPLPSCAMRMRCASPSK
jgi:hypothetical protein